MRSIYPKLKKNKVVFQTVMECKSLIDTIIEEKNLDDDHDLSLASRHLNNYLDAVESQNGIWCFDELTGLMGFKK